MKPSNAMIHFFMIVFISFVGLAQVQAQSSAAGRRLTEAQIRSEIRDAKNRISQERSVEGRKKQLQALIKFLEAEFNKGSASFDKTFVFVNKVLLDAENILYNDCRKSRSLIANQTMGQDPNVPMRDRVNREITEGLSLHGSFCSR